MSNYKLKNTATDLIVFLLYHVAAVVGSIAFFTAITQGIDSLKFGSISFVKSKIKTVNEAPVLQGATIHSIRGEVLISERGKEFLAAKEDQLLKEGSVLETREKSTAVVRFGKDYSCRVRISANTRVNLDALMAKDEVKKTESTFFNLVKGGIYLLLDNTSKEADVKIKTFSTVFAIRGTHIAVLTDGLQSSVLGVKEGNVEVDNLKTSKKIPVFTGSSYVANSTGADKVNDDPVVLERFNFTESTEVVVPDIEEVSTAIGEISEAGPTAVDPAAAEKQQLVIAIKAEIEGFKKENEQIISDIEAEKNELENVINKLATETPKLNNDINCIETSSQPCKLYSQELLVSRGFPRTYGDPRVRRSLIQDLRAYMKEQEAKIDDKRVYIKNTEELSHKRADVLKWAENALASGTGLEQILPKLQDKHLQR